MKRFLSFALATLLVFSVAHAEKKSIIYSTENLPELYELIHLDVKKDSMRIESIAKDLKGKSVELYLVTSFVEQYRKYKTRFNYVLYAMYGDKVMLSGSRFMFKDVAHRDLKLTGVNVPDSFDIGLACKVLAEVEGIENGFILLDPISTEVVSTDTAKRESVDAARIVYEKEMAKRKKGGFNPRTNRTIEWCGVEFSFPSYFDTLGEESTEVWTSYHPHEEHYYATLLFQSFELPDLEGLIEPEVFFNMSLTNIIEETFYSGEHFTDVTLTKSEKAETAGLSGWFVEYVSNPDSQGKYSIGNYFIAYNPEVHRVLSIMSVFDSKDTSRHDYQGDVVKMIQTAKKVDKGVDESEETETTTASTYDYAYARKFPEYSIYMLFDTGGETVRYFTTHETGVLVGSMKGDLESGITIHYEYDGQWNEVFKKKSSSQNEATLVDNDGFEWSFERVPVEEAEAILNSVGYHDVN